MPTENEDPLAKQTAAPALFAPRTPERTSFPTIGVGIAVVLVILGLVLFAFRGAKPAVSASATPLPPAAAARTLALSGIVMSEGISVSGGKYTYIDGRITNQGTATVTGITTQTLFANDAGSAPQLESGPLNLIRTRQPYVDVEPVSAEPLKPGDSHDFRLIFEGVSPGWNQQIPEIRLVSVTTR